jgi:hypothetical protein
MLDKFVMIAADLNAAETDNDIRVFEHAKSVRDGVAHGTVHEDSALPVKAVQDLLTRLLRLHLSRSP